MKLICRIVSTGLGVGYFPVAPGTMGALATLILFWIAPEFTSLQLSGIILGITIAAVFSATITEREMIASLGAERGKDPGIIVVDEIVGMLVTLVAVPKTARYLIAAFILFRIFDIVKPFPIRKIEKLHSGWGIVFDDIIAGIYANLVIQLIRIIF